MRISTLIALLMLLSQANALSQTTFTIHASTGIVTELKEAAGSDMTEIKIILPDKNFERLRIYLPNAELSFNCSPAGTSANKKCIELYSWDIQKGQILLSFKGRNLENISDRKIFNGYAVLSASGSNNISVSDNGFARRDYSFKTISVSTDVENQKDTSSTFVVCEKSGNEVASTGGMPGLTFLCPDSVLINKKCFCGFPVKNGFENMYLPPCFDPNGNAISVRYHVLVDMSTTDPLKKVFLFETVRGTLDTIQCSGLPFTGYEFARIKKRLKLKAGDIIAVSIIAHKDSSIVIETASANFFLDSAQAAQNAFTAAGNRTQPANDAQTVAMEKDPVNLVKAAVTLQGDLVYLNNFFRDGNFVETSYIQQLVCLQRNIARVFDLPVIPKSGRELAEALDAKISGNSNLQPYYAFVCRLLNQLIAEYDAALKHNSNYRIYTKPVQVPNADEFTVEIGTKTSNVVKSVYKHEFLVKGGLKLDIGTGVFLSGNNDRFFSIRSVRYTFRDSLTGATRDTVGNLIAGNSKRMNVNTGFLVHIYPRTGGYLNVGGVAGVTFNNSNFMFMLGGSFMFRMGNARLSLVAGAAFGQREELDANQRQYVFNEARFPQTKIYNQDNRPGQVVLADRLPRFFPEANVTTYNKFKTTHFFGITYNFASIKL